MPDAQLTLATSLIEGTFRLLEKTVWPLFFAYVLSKSVVRGWISMLVNRIAEVVEVRHGKTIVKLPPRTVLAIPTTENETISDRPPARSVPTLPQK